MGSVPTVLIADDEEIVRALMVKLLHRVQCDVVAVAQDGEEAIDLFRRHQPDITLLDINMPKMSGIDVLRKIREQDKESVVCMNSGDVIPEVIREIADLGVAGFLVKPIKYEKLLAIKQQFIDSRSGTSGNTYQSSINNKPFYPPDEELENARKLVDSIAFPAMPEAVASLQRELLKDEPDNQTIAKIISHDIKLSGTLLNLVNSAAYGLKQKVNSISQAVVMVGQSRLKSVVLASALRNSFLEEGEFQNDFWDRANATAVSSEMLSHAVIGVSPEDAFLAGLFQDSGALICEKKNKRYGEIYRHAHSVVATILNFDRKICKTSHMAISYILAKKWELPDHICDAILLSHVIDCSKFESGDMVDLRALVSILTVSNYIVGSAMHPDVEIKAEGVTAFKTALEEIMIDEDVLFDASDVVNRAVAVAH